MWGGLGQGWDRCSYVSCHDFVINLYILEFILEVSKLRMRASTTDDCVNIHAIYCTSLLFC